MRSDPGSQGEASAPRQAAEDAWFDALCAAVREGRGAARVLEGRVAAFGLSEVEFRLLRALQKARASNLASSAPGCESGACRDQTWLASHLAVSAAQISATVMKLQQTGLVEGRRPVANRRRQVWQLAAAGDALLRAVIERQPPADRRPSRRERHAPEAA